MVRETYPHPWKRPSQLSPIRTQEEFLPWDGGPTPVCLRPFLSFPNKGNKFLQKVLAGSSFSARWKLCVRSLCPSPLCHHNVRARERHHKQTRPRHISEWVGWAWHCWHTGGGTSKFLSRLKKHAGVLQIYTAPQDTAARTATSTSARIPTSLRVRTKTTGQHFVCNMVRNNSTLRTKNRLWNPLFGDTKGKRQNLWSILSKCFRAK